MTVGDWLKIVGGLVIIVAVFYDLFQSVILPRPAVGKVALTRYALRLLWRLWRWIGLRRARVYRRERWLAYFGPIAVFVLFGIWVLALDLGYALIFNGLRTGLQPVQPTFGSALYFSSTTLVPLSYGDVLPVSTPARVVTVAETGTGIILAALVITLLFSLYQSFQRREELVVTLDAMAGAPPSGVQILESAAEHGMRNELVDTLDDWRRWAAAVLESHLAYPILVYFRSSHDNEAWLNSFGAIMDAAALVVSTIEDGSEGPARLMLTVGNHLVDDFAAYFSLRKSAEPYIEREEFEEATKRLVTAGYRSRPNRDVWKEFSALRSRYAGPLNEMNKRLAIIPAQWIGDRSYLPHQKQARRTLRRGARTPRRSGN